MNLTMIHNQGLTIYKINKVCIVICFIIVIIIIKDHCKMDDVNVQFAITTFRKTYP